MISQWSFSARYGRHGLHQILNWFKTISLWSLREAGFQWTLSDLWKSANGLISLSMISQQSANKRNRFCELSWSINDLRWSQLVSQRAALIAQWALNELSWLLFGLSTKAQRSPKSLRCLRWSPWNLPKINFWVPQWSSIAFPLRQPSWGVLETAERSCPFLVAQWSRLLREPKSLFFVFYCFLPS